MFGQQAFATGFNPSYQGAMWAGAANSARQQYGQNQDYAASQRQSQRQGSLRKAGLQSQAMGNRFSLYSGLGDLSNTAYSNYLQNRGGYRDFAIGALSGLMR